MASKQEHSNGFHKPRDISSVQKWKPRCSLWSRLQIPMVCRHMLGDVAKTSRDLLSDVGQRRDDDMETRVSSVGGWVKAG